MVELQAGAVEVEGRLLLLVDRMKAIRRGIVKRKRTLANSQAYVAAARVPRPADRARWAKLAGEIVEFEFILAKLERGEEVELSPRTGKGCATLPDYLGQRDREDT